MEEDTTGGTRTVPPEIAFDYIKSAAFRVVHADGVTGGIAPSGNIHMAFFSERGPIPQREVRALNSEGQPGEVLPEKSIIRPAIIREVDFDVVMSLRVTDAVIDWLQRAAAELRRAAMPADKKGHQP
jgi:hypothetical protein